MTLPCLNVFWAHRCFQAIVIFALTSHVFWIVSRLWNLKEGVTLACASNIIFDIQFLPLPSLCGIELI
jgi:hypothetical protein